MVQLPHSAGPTAVQNVCSCTKCGAHVVDFQPSYINSHACHYGHTDGQSQQRYTTLTSSSEEQMAVVTILLAVATGAKWTSPEVQMYRYTYVCSHTTGSDLSALDREAHGFLKAYRIFLPIAVAWCSHTCCSVQGCTVLSNREIDVLHLKLACGPHIQCTIWQARAGNRMKDVLHVYRPIGGQILCSLGQDTRRCARCRAPQASTTQHGMLTWLTESGQFCLVA